jgi:hypothetical protein
MTEVILHRAIERGLSAADFENMTLGMVIDYLIVCQNEEIDARQNKNGPARMATEADVNAF